jgi:alpha-1,2-mannosyltransferase
VDEDRHVAHLVIERALTTAAGLLLAGPPLMVGAIGLGSPAGLAWLLPVGLAGAALLSGRVPPLPLGAARAHPVAALLWTAALAVAVTFSVRTSLYAHYPDAPRFSVAPGDRFREEHLCMTAYAEAARFLSAAVPNVYEPALYRSAGVPRRIGQFTVDYYHYPPPFLLVPVAVRAVAPDFYDFRRVWFALQTSAMIGLWLGIAWWVGGITGRRFALAGVGLIALPVSWASIQVGNIQSTVIAVALVGAMAVASGRVAGGAALLSAAALGKIFPAVLLVHVLSWGRPRVLAWTVAWGVGIAALTAIAFGLEIFGHFIFGELPRMLSGEAFSQTENPPTAVVNQSIYGLTVKLRLLGIELLHRDAGKAVTRGLVTLLGLAAVVVGWRVVRPVELDSNERRLGALVITFGFANFASLLSPFVGGAYGALYTIWLGALLAISALPGRVRSALAFMTAVLVIANALTASPRTGVLPSTTTLLISLTASGMTFAINIAAIWIGSRLLAGHYPERNAPPA